MTPLPSSPARVGALRTALAFALAAAANCANATTWRPDDATFANGTDIRIPDGVTEIAENAFDGFYQVASVSMPDSVTHIGGGAFYLCGNLTNVVLSANLESIGDHAFAYCTALREIRLPDTLTEIKYGAFRACTSLEYINIPDSVSDFGSFAFMECNALKGVRLPRSLKNLPDKTFEGCASLAAVTASQTTEITNTAFAGCVSLDMRNIREEIDEIPTRYGSSSVNIMIGDTLKPTDSRVADAIAGSADRYNAFAHWANNIPGGAATALASSNAAASFLLDAPRIFENAPRIAISSFSVSPADGSATLEVEIKDGEIPFPVSSATIAKFLKASRIPAGDDPNPLDVAIADLAPGTNSAHRFSVKPATTGTPPVCAFFAIRVTSR